MWAGIAQSVEHFATGWTVRGSNSDWGETSSTQGRSGLVPGLSLEGKATEAKGGLATSTYCEVKERVELYLYSLFGPSRSVLG